MCEGHDDNFGIGMIVGFVFATLFWVGFFDLIIPNMKASCEAELPRSQQCKYIAVPVEEKPNA